MNMESWHPQNETSENSEAKSVTKFQVKQRNDTIHEIDSIHEKEKRADVSDFVTENERELKEIGLSSDQLIDELLIISEKLKMESPAFSLWDNGSLPLLKRLLRSRSLKSTDRSGHLQWKAEEKSANTASEYLESLNERGFDNATKIGKMQDAHERGEINILPQKLQQYRNFLALLTEDDFADDRAVIRKVINSSQVDLDDPTSFEQVLQRLAERPDISELTKEKISVRFNFHKLETGHDLKFNLSKRQEQRAEAHRTLEVIRNNQTILETEKDLLEAEIEELKEKLLSPVDADTRFALETELKGLKQRLQEIEAKLISLKEQEDSTLVPTEEVVVRMGRAMVIDGIIHLYLPGSGRELVLPEIENGQLVGQVVNSYFVYENLRKYGLEHALFPEHKLGSSDLPSANIVTKANNMLDLLGLHNTGMIATQDDLEVLDNTLRVFRNHEDLDSNRQQDADEAELDLQELGLLESGNFNWEKFVGALEFLRVNRKPRLHSFDGIKNHLLNQH